MVKKSIKFLWLIMFAAIIGGAFFACSNGTSSGGNDDGGNDNGGNDNGGNDGGSNRTVVNFNSVTANGSSSQTTTQLTLNFSQAISGLSSYDITLSGVTGVTKGALGGYGPTYTLPISGFISGKTLTVSVSKSGYKINGSPKEVNIFYNSTVTFSSVTANGSTTETTTQLTLTFSQEIPDLSSTDISLSGVTGTGVIKGALSGSGSTYTLPISGFTAGGTLTVTVSKTGYTISGSPKTVGIFYYTQPSAGITVELAGVNEWELGEQTAQVLSNTNKTFTVSGTYTSYQWYLDGVAVGTSQSYTFNKPEGVYQLVVMVTNTNGESRSGRCRVVVSGSLIFSENFNGTTHSFTIVNGTQTNQWYVGSATANGSGKSAYISIDSGTSNSYNTASSSVVHMYRNVTFPTSTTAYTLSFDWKAQGEGSSTRYDYLRVFLIETSVTPTAGSQPSGTTLGTYNLGGTDWNTATISIPATNSGTTKRLVFTWANDNNTGTQPPAAVDNIELSR